jgi:hypothetical protein
VSPSKPYVIQTPEAPVLFAAGSVGQAP